MNSAGMIRPRSGCSQRTSASAAAASPVASATRDVKPLWLVGFAAGLIAFSVVLFSYLLKVPMPAFAFRGFGF